MTRPADIRRDIDLALGGDARMSVVAVRRLGAENLRWLEDRAVRVARAEGYSWAQIGRLLGRSRQAVRQRFGNIDGTVQPLPLGPGNDEERVMSGWYRSTACTRRHREFLDTDPSDVVPW
jgi:hypothetical protein